MIPDKFNIPLTLKPDINYIDQLEAHLDEFANQSEKWIDSLVGLKILPDLDRDNIVIQVKDSKKRIIGILKEYVYRERFKAVDDLKAYIDINQSIFGSKNFYGTVPAGNLFYRFRGDKVKTTERDKHSLFHIPFSKRRKVNNGRFNAHGIPCFYCADKLSIAWKELKRPGSPDFVTSKNRFNAGVFKSHSEIDYIDLSLKKLSDLYDEIVLGGLEVSFFTEYICLYPFIISLHTKVEYDPDDYVAFHAEYIMPSFLMDVLLSSFGGSFFLNIIDLKSVRYSSVEDDIYFSGYNYVFPAKYVELKPDEYCQILTSIFLQDKNFYYIYEDELIGMGMSGVPEAELPNIESILRSKIS